MPFLIISPYIIQIQTYSPTIYCTCVMCKAASAYTSPCSIMMRLLHSSCRTLHAEDIANLSRLRIASSRYFTHLHLSLPCCRLFRWWDDAADAAAFLLPWHAWQIRMQLFIEKCQPEETKTTWVDSTWLACPHEWMNECERVWMRGSPGMVGASEMAGAVTSDAPLFGQFNYAISRKMRRAVVMVMVLLCS